MNISNKQLFLILLYLAIINAYLIFPVEYLPEEKYKIFLNRKPEDETKEEMLQRLYYRILMTQIELGTPKKTFTFLLDSDDDRYFVASSLPPKININEREKEAVYYNFDKSELLNESYSSTYKKGPCEAVDYNTFHYAELCTAKDIALFNQNNQKIEKNFEFRMVRINEDSIPGFLGLLYNYRYTRTKHPNFINELRGQNLIENNYWFFDFKKVSPFNRILEGNLVIGGLPHEIYPERFKKDDYVILHKSKRAPKKTTAKKSTKKETKPEVPVEEKPVEVKPVEKNTTKRPKKAPKKKVTKAKKTTKKAPKRKTTKKKTTKPKKK